MKDLSAIMAFLLMVFAASAQAILPADKNFRQTKVNSDSSTSELLKFLKGNSIFGPNLIGVSDTSMKEELDAARIATNIARIELLNKTSPVRVILNGAVSNLENIDQSYGTLSLGLQARLSPYKLNKKGRIDPHYLYLIFNTKTATSPDSSSIQKTFLFPELNKRDFVLGYFWQVEDGTWFRSFNFEFSLNRFSDTSSTKEFISQSFTAGYKVQKGFQLENPNVNVFFQLFPYYSLLNVDKKFKDFTTLLGEPTTPRIFHTLGLQASLQIDRAVLFCNMKYVLNRTKGIQSPDLVRFVYTIGTGVVL